MIAAIAAAIPIIAKLLDLVLNWVGASAADREAIKKAIHAAQTGALISQQNSDSQIAHRADIKAQIEKDQLEGKK